MRCGVRRAPFITAAVMVGLLIAAGLLHRPLCSSGWTQSTSPAAGLDEHMMRVRKQGDLRPMADDRSAMAELRTILAPRTLAAPLRETA